MQRDAELAVLHDYPDSKFGDGYMLFTRWGASEALDEAYLAAWTFHAVGVI